MFEIWYLVYLHLDWGWQFQKQIHFLKTVTTTLGAFISPVRFAGIGCSRSPQGIGLRPIRYTRYAGNHLYYVWHYIDSDFHASRVSREFELDRSKLRFIVQLLGGERKDEQITSTSWWTTRSNWGNCKCSTRFLISNAFFQVRLRCCLKSWKYSLVFAWLLFILIQ